MAKLILSMEGLVLKEIPLVRERTTIGRKPNNDIQIDNLAISGEHAVVVTVINDSFLEDLDSTNGTLVNGQPVKKHFLQDGDVIELGKYRLKYLSEADARPAQDDFEKTVVLRPEMMRGAAERPVAPGAGVPPGLTCGGAGRELELVKPTTTLGKQGVQVAMISRRPHGCFIVHVEGNNLPSVNGERLVAGKPHALLDLDIIELGGVRMEFRSRG